MAAGLPKGDQAQGEAIKPGYSVTNGNNKSEGYDMIKKICDYLIFKYDNFIYGLMYNSFRRVLSRHIGNAYFVELHLRDWRKSHKMSKELKLATEKFYKQMCEERKKHVREN